MPQPQYRPFNARGYTLLEVVVALAVMALMLGLIYQSLGWGLQRSSQVQMQRIALLQAQSLIADFSSRSNLAVGTYQGELGNRRQWQVEVRQYPSHAGGDSFLAAYELSTEVRWGIKPTQRVRLQSICLTRREP
jgi:prepilin-type N-terminal cleavage/methylation domain-containing protein